MRSARAFTVIELIIVVTIIAILASLLIPAINQGIRQRRATATRLTMANLAQAITAYIGDFGVLGDVRDASSSDFAAKPLEFLVARRIRDHVVPYLEVTGREGRALDAYGKPVEARPGAMEVLLDAWGDPLIITVKNARAATSKAALFDFAEEIVIRSRAGTPGKDGDDIRLRYTNATDKWANVDK